MQPTTRWSLQIILCTSLFLLRPTQTDAQYVPENPTPDSIRERLARHAQFLADLADRPRRVIYTPYPVSPMRGLVAGFVHVSDGTAVLSRTDLVVDAPLPIVFRRAYHSARSSSTDFGAGGWRLTIAEEIVRHANGHWSYTYGNGNSVAFDAQGRFEPPAEAHFSDVREFRAAKEATIDVVMRTGIQKRFRRMGDVYSLVEVADAFGNKLDYRYTPRGALSGIGSSNGAWVVLERDRFGRIKSVQDSHGRAVHYGFDPKGHLVSVKDAGGQIWNYDYDKAHRLVATTTPNGVIDTEFAYGAAGRVKSSRANGLRSQFAYANSTTSVTDSRDLTTRYRAAKTGLTAEVTNALGTTTAVRFSRDGLPTHLERNGTSILEFFYEAAGQPTPNRALFVNPTSGETYEVAYDSRSRVVAVKSTLRGTLFSVASYGPGLVAERITFADGSAEEALFDVGGELARYTKRDGTALMFERTSERWRISNAEGKAVDLKFDTPGRLVSAALPSGVTLKFAYNHVGLRETTETSYGARVSYTYDASGSLFHSSMSYGERLLPAYTYVLGVDQRVDAVQTSDDERYDFIYDTRGLLTAVRQPSGDELKYEYDGQARLLKAQYKDRTPLEYMYGPGEPDIATQLSYRAIPVFNQQREVSDFASRFEVGLTRIRPAAFGLLTYNDVSGELTIAADPARWNPIAPIGRSLSALHLETLLSDEANGVQSFSNPANRLFVPREYWSVNCCICICEEGSPPSPGYGPECNQP